MYTRKITDVTTKIRKMRGLDRHEFAYFIGKDYLTVAKWENGQAEPTAEDLYTIAEKFEISPLLFGLPEREPAAELPSAEKEEARAPEIEEPKAESAAEKAAVEIICSEKLTEPDEEQTLEAFAEETAEEPTSTPVSEPEETPAPQAPAVTAKEARAYEEKKARYEKHVRLSSYTRASVKIRRVLAYTVDVFISLLLCLALAVAAGIVIAGFLKTKLDLFATAYAISAAFAVSFVAIFVFRDWIFGGRSLGKRMFCLKVVDEKTGKKAFVWQRIWRTLLTVDIFDIFLLVFTGRTVGDRISGALVVSSRHYRKPVIPALDELGEPIYDIPERPRKNHTLLTLLIVLLTVAAILLSGFAVYKLYRDATELEKESDEYDYALTYLADNAEDEIAEEELQLLGFSYHFNEKGNVFVTYIFYVDGNLYTVCVSEINSGVWAVCQDCTYVK